jgi:hypothetical protein
MSVIQGHSGRFLTDEYAWAQRHTAESWKERYKRHTDRLARRIKEIVSERPDTDRTAIYAKDRRLNGTRYAWGQELEEMEAREDADELELQVTQRQVHRRARKRSACSRLCIIGPQVADITFRRANVWEQEEDDRDL